MINQYSLFQCSALTLPVFEDLNILVLLDWMIGGTWGLGDRRPGKLVANWFAGRILVFDPTILVSGHWPDIVCWLAGGLAGWHACLLAGRLAGWFINWHNLKWTEMQKITIEYFNIINIFYQYT